MRNIQISGGNLGALLTLIFTMNFFVMLQKKKTDKFFKHLSNRWRFDARVFEIVYSLFEEGGASETELNILLTSANKLKTLSSQMLLAQSLRAIFIKVIESSIRAGNFKYFNHNEKYFLKDLQPGDIFQNATIVLKNEVVSEPEEYRLMHHNLSVLKHGRIESHCLFSYTRIRDIWWDNDIIII